MCEFFVKADPIQYEQRSRSVRIHGVLTSLRLENMVWDILAEMAEPGPVSAMALGREGSPQWAKQGAARRPHSRAGKCCNAGWSTGASLPGGLGPAMNACGVANPRRVSNPAAVCALPAPMADPNAAHCHSANRP